MSGSRKGNLGKVNDVRTSVSKALHSFNIPPAASFKDNRTSNSSIQDKNSSSSSNIQDPKSSITPGADTKSSSQPTNFKDNATSVKKDDAPK
ncbi:hypothetical protein IFR04_005711 [Cadophora malorum]|uniref:Uncharacterized protein n=1 Tax=Cadophora malorum TaxID=108018 RepID=A0A8H7TLP0_9HELO|nr:hypothetical protein IFR04_005711 [Cadophora malorum]